MSAGVNAAGSNASRETAGGVGSDIGADARLSKVVEDSVGCESGSAWVSVDAEGVLTSGDGDLEDAGRGEDADTGERVDAEEAGERVLLMWEVTIEASPSTSDKVL